MSCVECDNGQTTNLASLQGSMNGINKLIFGCGSTGPSLVTALGTGVNVGFNISGYSGGLLRWAADDQNIFTETAEMNGAYMELADASSLNGQVWMFGGNGNWDWFNQARWDIRTGLEGTVVQAGPVHNVYAGSVFEWTASALGDVVYELQGGRIQVYSAGVLKIGKYFVLTCPGSPILILADGIMEIDSTAVVQDCVIQLSGGTLRGDAQLAGFSTSISVASPGKSTIEAGLAIDSISVNSGDGLRLPFTVDMTSGSWVLEKNITIVNSLDENGPGLEFHIEWENPIWETNSVGVTLINVPSMGVAFTTPPLVVSPDLPSNCSLNLDPNTFVLTMHCTAGNVCAVDSDCDTECQFGFCDLASDTCEPSVGNQDKPDGTLCNDGSGNTRCYQGTCSQCAVDDDCPDTATECYVDVCDAGTCALSPLTPGTVCGGGDMYCDDSHVCQECYTDSHCDDGDVCNGDEECDSGFSCIPGANAIAGTPCGDPSSTTVCNGIGTCGACATGNDCSNGNPCDGEEVCNTVGAIWDCDPGASVPANGTDCGNGRFCDGISLCIECFEDSDCSDGEFCNGQETCSSVGLCEDGSVPEECRPDGSSSNNDSTTDLVTAAVIGGGVAGGLLLLGAAGFLFCRASAGGGRGGGKNVDDGPRPMKRYGGTGAFVSADFVLNSTSSATLSSDTLESVPSLDSDSLRGSVASSVGGAAPGGAGYTTTPMTDMVSLGSGHVSMASEMAPHFSMGSGAMSDWTGAGAAPSPPPRPGGRPQLLRDVSRDTVYSVNPGS